MLLSNILALHHSHYNPQNKIISSNNNNPSTSDHRIITTAGPRHVRAQATSNQTGPVKMTKVKTSHAQKKRLARSLQATSHGSSDTLTASRAQHIANAYIMNRLEARTSNGSGRHKKKMLRNGS